MTLHTALQDLDYPCTYPYKLICRPDAVETVRGCVLRTLGPQAQVLDVHQRASKNGKYIALTISITASSAAQIESVYAALRGVDGIVTSL